MANKSKSVQPPVVETRTPDERLRKLCSALRNDGFYAIANEIESEVTFSNVFRHNLLLTLFRNV